MVRHQAGLPGLLWEVSGTHPGAAPTGGGPPELKAQRGETLVLPTEGTGGKGRKEGGAILVPHPPFPTLKGGSCGSWDFPEQQKILGNQRQLRGGADSRPPFSSPRHPQTLFKPPLPSDLSSSNRRPHSLLFPQSHRPHLVLLRPSSSPSDPHLLPQTLLALLHPQTQNPQRPLSQPLRAPVGRAQTPPSPYLGPQPFLHRPQGSPGVGGPWAAVQHHFLGPSP